MVFHLEEVREVNEHVIARLFLPARDVETNCHDVEAFTPLRELVFHRESV